MYLIQIILFLLNFRFILLPTQVSPEILTRGKNEAKSPNQSKANFEYLWVGKVQGINKKLGSPSLFWRFWPLKVQNWPKGPKPYQEAQRAKQDHFSTCYQALITNFIQHFGIWTLKCQNRPILAKIGPKLVENGQNHISWNRKPYKSNFSHSLRP